MMCVLKYYLQSIRIAFETPKTEFAAIKAIENFIECCTSSIFLSKFDMGKKII